jgi:hypothetical protein
VSLLAIGCEAVGKKAGLTIAGKSFRLYRPDAAQTKLTPTENLLGSDSYFFV